MARHWKQLQKTARTGLAAAGRDLAHRMAGSRAEIGARLRREDAVDDAVLAERVRARLGRLVARPQAVMVVVDAGRVTLSGRVSPLEREALVSAIAGVRGVTAVEDGLEGLPIPVRRRPTLPRHWAPGFRLLAGGAGLALVLGGLARRGPLGAALSAAGVALGTRALADQPLRAVVGRAPADPVRLNATILIDAPIGRVFSAWSDLEAFPRIMARIHDVVVYGDGRHSCWLVNGPLGLPMEFDAVITDLMPNDTIAWRSLAGSTVKHGGSVRFLREGAATRVHVRVTYDPPAGALGELAAAALGADPERWLKADLRRMKRAIEVA